MSNKPEDESLKIEQQIKREEVPSTEKLLNIREETRVETLADNFETINPVKFFRKISNESKRQPTEETSTGSHSRSRSGSSVKDFARSVSSSIRRNHSFGSYEDQIKNMMFNCY